MPVTMKDIAQLCGVSRQAVAAALQNGSGSRVSAQTREKILKLARELHYVPNAAAQVLAHGTSGGIGILTRTGYGFNALILAMLQEHLCAAGFESFTSELPLDDTRAALERAISSLAGRGAEAVIMLGASVERPAETALPCVSCAGINVPYDIAIDKVATGRIAAEHLISHGCRRIVFLSFSERGRRSAGWQEALAAHHLDCPEEFFIGTRDLDGNMDLIEERLRRVHADGAVCVNDFVAARLIRELAFRKWNIPGDLAVTGCDGFSFADFTTPTLTTVIQPLFPLVSLCVEMLKERIAGKVCNIPCARETIAPALLCGGSCGCPERRPGRFYRINTGNLLERDYLLNFNCSLNPIQGEK